MGMTQSTAPGKIILCGEHAVVYGRPAIALPLESIRATVQVEDGIPGDGVSMCAPDLEREWIVDKNSTDPLGELLFSTLRCLGLSIDHVRVTITSDIPIAGGMGSGAAVSTALVRALMEHLGHTPPPSEVSALVYACEKRYHGTPSGIDNTVIAFEQPIWFVRASASDTPTTERAAPSLKPVMEPLQIAQPLTLVIGDTGVRSKTRLPVGELRRSWENDTTFYEGLFDQVGNIVSMVRDHLDAGTIAAIGPLLSENHKLLQTMGVSSPELDTLVAAAHNAGALGAKMSGAGWGGVMFALTEPSDSNAIAQALKNAGAARVLETRVGSNSATM